MPLNIPTVGETAQQFSNLRQAKQMEQMRALQMEQERNRMAREQTQQEALAGLMPQYAGLSPEQAMRMEQLAGMKEQRGLAREEMGYKRDDREIQLIGRLASGVKNATDKEGAYQFALQEAKNAGLDVSQLPQAYNEQVEPLLDVIMAKAGISPVGKSDLAREKFEFQKQKFGIETAMKQEEIRLKREPKPKTEAEKFAQEDKLRDEVNTFSKEFVKQQDAYNRVQASAEDPSAAGDLALIFNYMKVLDPGSTVREGEFATAQNAGGVDDRTMAWYNKIIRGERLSNKQRKDFVNRSDKLYKKSENQFQKRIKPYEKIIKNNGLNRENVMLGFELAGDKQEQKGKAQEGEDILGIL